MFGKWGQRRARRQWEATLCWFRLRYQEAAGVQRSLQLLSRAEACGRVALYYQPGAVAQLYLGVPERHRRLVQQMARDFAFLLREEPGLALPEAQRMMAVDALPWERPFLAHLVQERPYVTLLDEGRPAGRYWSAPSGRAAVPEWRLPAAPPLGVSSQPDWTAYGPPASAVELGAEWALGWSVNGRVVQGDGRVQLYGRAAAAADWLVPLVLHRLERQPAGVVLLDGQGDLAAQLKRKAAVTRLLDGRLTYLDLDGALTASGFNPLAAVPGEREEQLVSRWERWFGGMGVHPHSLALLAPAYAAGVRDIPGLRKWLRQQERQGQYAAVASLEAALNQLTSSRQLREWLEWPTNPYETLEGGALFLTCQATGWAQQQLLRAALLAAVQLADVALVVHGFPWQTSDVAAVARARRLVVSNAPQMAGSMVVVTESHPQGAAAVVDRFCAAEAAWRERVELLSRGEGVVLVEDAPFFVTWNGRGEGAKAVLSVKPEVRAKAREGV
jgi:hypothetical protein